MAKKTKKKKVKMKVVMMILDPKKDKKQRCEIEFYNLYSAKQYNKINIIIKTYLKNKNLLF